MPDYEELEMVNVKLFGHVKELTGKEAKVGHEYMKLREQMVGQIDAIIKRQDHYGIE